MRKIKLTAVEASAIYNILNSGDPQRGVSVQTVRTMLPIFDKLEAKAERVPIKDGERLEFDPSMEIELKEPEYQLIKTQLEQAGGFTEAQYVRKVLIPLLDRLTETPSIEEPK